MVFKFFNGIVLGFGLYFIWKKLICFRIFIGFGFVFEVKEMLYCLYSKDIEIIFKEVFKFEIWMVLLMLDFKFVVVFEYSFIKNK